MWIRTWFKEITLSTAEKAALGLLTELVEGSVFRFISFNIFINELDINIRSTLQKKSTGIVNTKEVEHHRKRTV